MATHRDRSLAAAVELLGTSGLRSLTHARVDAQAGLARGSTSNYFRTRAALLDGVVTWIAQGELGDIDPFDPESATGDDLVEAFCVLLERETGPGRVRTIARYVLFLESAGDGAPRAPLLANRQRFEQWTTIVLAGLGAPDPDTAARALMAFGDGLILHRITVDPTAPLRPAVALVVRACLAGPPPAAG